MRLLKLFFYTLFHPNMLQKQHALHEIGISEQWGNDCNYTSQIVSQIDML